MPKKKQKINDETVWVRPTLYVSDEVAAEILAELENPATAAEAIKKSVKHAEALKKQLEAKAPGFGGVRL